MLHLTIMEKTLVVLEHADGEITASISGGTPNYVYSLDGSNL